MNQQDHLTCHVTGVWNEGLSSHVPFPIPGTSVCGEYCVRILVKIYQRSRCQWPWTNLWVRYSGCVRSWNIVSCSMRRQNWTTRTTEWWVVSTVFSPDPFSRGWVVSIAFCHLSNHFTLLRRSGWQHLLCQHMPSPIIGWDESHSTLSSERRMSVWERTKGSSLLQNRSANLCN